MPERQTARGSAGHSRWPTFDTPQGHQADVLLLKERGRDHPRRGYPRPRQVERPIQQTGGKGSA
jgi:hypothetical protein